METNESSGHPDGDPYIAGIYSYCDRWCERCRFTARCRSFAMAARDGVPASGPESNEFWQKLSATFERTLARLQEEGDRIGVDLSASLRDLARLGDERRATLKGADLAKAAREYVTMVDGWFDREAPIFGMRERSLQELLELGIEGSTREEAAGITDALEVVRWYQFFISAKLARALRGRECVDHAVAYSPEEHAEKEWEELYANDADGSVKAALVAIDRSIGAWGSLMERFPECADSILSVLVHLDRLRRGCEREFPDARNFLRPGFDTEPED